MAPTSTVVHIIAAGFTGLGLLFAIVSQATDYWIERDIFNRVKVHWGLWRSCGEINGKTTCNTLELNGSGEFTDKFRTTRGFTILAILAYGLAGMFLLLSLLKKVHVFLFMLVVAAAGVFQLIGMAIFTDIYKDRVDLITSADFGWSFNLGWSAVAMALISFGFGIVIKVTSSREEIV